MLMDRLDYIFIHIRAAWGYAPSSGDSRASDR